MPFFAFYRVLEDGSRTRLARLELVDREAARQFGIELTHEILEAEEEDDRSSVETRVVIYDAQGEDLDIIVTGRF